MITPTHHHETNLPYPSGSARIALVARRASIGQPMPRVLSTMLSPNAKVAKHDESVAAHSGIIRRIQLPDEDPNAALCQRFVPQTKLPCDKSTV